MLRASTVRLEPPLPPPRLMQRAIVRLTGQPGAGVPAFARVTTSDGRIMVLTQAACIGPNGYADVEVEGPPAISTVEEQPRARVWARSRYELLMSEVDWWS